VSCANWSLCGVIQTRRSASGYGSGRNNTALMMLKNRGVQADAECERQDGHGRDERRPHQLP